MGQNVRFHVIGIDDRDPKGKGKCFGKRGANQQRSEQPRPPGIGYGMQLIFIYLCPIQGLLNHRNDVLLVGSRGKFGDDAAECPVHILVGNQVG